MGATATERLLLRAVSAASRAPSVYNTQPWRFLLGDDGVDLWLDLDRVLPVIDPDAREARLSCGAALYNLCLVIAVSCRAPLVEPLPDSAHPDLLATVRLGGAHTPSADELALERAVERRQTNRRPFLDRPIPTAARSALVRAANDEGAWLAFPHAAGQVAALVQRADHIQGQDPAYLAELREWTHQDGNRRDGVRAPARAPAAGIAVPRDFAPHRRDRRSDPFETDPQLAVLVTRTDTARSQLNAGRALQRVLLSAEVAGLAVSPLSQPVEVPEVRAALAELVGGAPQLVLRLGYGYPGAPTPRRPLSAVAAPAARRIHNPRRSETDAS
ncbi:hypothetical protein BJP25_11990 [Actinokineospora bangkokensis]|uniref:Nitroreductase domain-containing protein n=1 Tax=Actinokineospora bangkokensis TaxID=1193682 RepID=A0A1Q9LRX3_9PSEU|nr:hypothetical protein BJP25_11990 [Actinokineospora bangkokensis]